MSTREQVDAALALAVAILAKTEPGDSRAVSDEFVALAAVSCGLADAATDRVVAASMAALTPPT